MRFPILKDHANESLLKRLNILMFVIIFIVIILVLYLINLQFIKGAKYKKMAENNRIKEIPIVAQRGFILDRNGKLIVSNKGRFFIRIVREYAGNVSATLDNLSQIIKFKKNIVLKSMQDAYYYEQILVSKDASWEVVSYILENNYKFPGVYISYQPVRTYNENISLSHILGYLGEPSNDDLKNGVSLSSNSSIGLAGVEKSYNDILQGVDGVKLIESDRFDRDISILNETSPMQGNSIYLSIDLDLQNYVQELLSKDTAAAVVMNISNGELLSIVSAPTYNISKFIDNDTYVSEIFNDESKPLLDRTIAGTYPPGSTFKIFTALAALSEGIITNKSTESAPGFFVNNGMTFYDWKRSGHGNAVDIYQALEESVDVFFYKVGLKTGIANISKYAKLMGIGYKTGIDLPGEKQSLMPDAVWKNNNKHQPWFPGDTIITSIGQGSIALTPIDLAQGVSTVLNAGTIVTPHVALYSYDNIKKEKKPLVFKKNKNININPGIVQDIITGMYRVVYGQHATARKARLPNNYQLIGKTGTSQVVSLTFLRNVAAKGKVPKKYLDHAFFVAGFPYPDPKYVIVVLIEHGLGGGSRAGPIARDIIMKMIELGYV